MALMRRLRDAVDPGGLANPGKVLAPAPRARARRDAGGRQRRGGAGGGPRGAARAAGRRRHEAGAVDAARRRRRSPSTCPSLRGLVEYDPAELTFTALAGTPVAELDEALAVHGQHLPFDPPLSAAGATLGGVVAAGTSRPRRASATAACATSSSACGSSTARGRLVAGGGKVVKNAAGFDLPKLMVGSMGRLGVIVAALAQGLPASARDHDRSSSTSPAPRPRSTPWRGSAAGRWTSTRWTSIRRRACSCASAATPTRSRRAPPASPRPCRPPAGRSAPSEDAALWRDAAELAWVPSDAAGWSARR